MKLLPSKYLVFSLALLAFAPFSEAATVTLSSTTFATNSTYVDDGFVQSGTTTWTINPTVVVTATTGRFFIGESTAPNNSDAIFVVDGGGLLQISNANAFTMRLGQNQNFEAGVLRITGGSTVSFTGDQGPWSEESNGVSYGDTTSRSRIELSGLGSTLMAEGTYNSVSGLYNRAGVAGNALPITATGVGQSLSVSYDAGTNVTTFTVVPEPSIALLGSLGVLGLLRRKR